MFLNVSRLYIPNAKTHLYPQLISSISVTGFARLMWLVLLLFGKETCLILSVPQDPVDGNWLDSMWRLHLWGLVKRCRIITGSLQKKLSEGSWEAKDKPRLQGSN